MRGAVDIQIWRLILAYGLFLVVFILIWIKQLHLGRDLIYSVLRMTIQLIIMGFVLDSIFQVQLPFIITMIFLIMILFATHTIVKRSSISFLGVYRILFFSMVFGCTPVILFFLLLIVHNQPWYDPKYFIPLAGMVMGNSMNGSALALERFYDDIKIQNRKIETMISLGATAHEASFESFQKAYRSALLPILTNMTGMGIVFIPGMMTGQILGGSPPLTAIKYQIAIMAAILGSVALTSFLILTLENRHFFNKYHLLREEILKNN